MRIVTSGAARMLSKLPKLVAEQVICHIQQPSGDRMPTICPIAVAVGCRKCPIYRVCPMTTLIGDQLPRKPEKSLSRSAPKKRKSKRSSAKPKT
jgi:hypothetical protein